MNMNFFEWLRNGVRQSVVLGVSDAVEQLGVPENDAEVQPALASVLGLEAQPQPKGRGKKTGTAASRKRLGKTLKEMEPSK